MTYSHNDFNSATAGMLLNSHTLHGITRLLQHLVMASAAPREVRLNVSFRSYFLFLCCSFTLLLLKTSRDVIYRL